jgi:hypothetical protein
MSPRNKTLGSLGLAVAVLAALTVTACDPYQAANTSAPVVLGVTMFDVNMVAYNNAILPPDSAGCTRPYPAPDQTWANSVFPGLCNPDNLGLLTTVCPVLCYPPRQGPAYAPFFLGNLGGTYQTNVAQATFTYAVPPAYTLGSGPFQSPVPPVYSDADGNDWAYQRIDILFNKVMNPQTIQPNPNDCLPQADKPVNLRITENGVNITPTTAICYNPNSDVTFWGASIQISPEAGILNNAIYVVTGEVADYQGATLPINVTVTTGANLGAPVSLTYDTANATYTVGTAITANNATLVGDGWVEYTITPALPAGLAINSSTGKISGIPTAAKATTTYTVEAANGAGSVKTTIVITVSAAAAAN